MIFMSSETTNQFENLDVLLFSSGAQDYIHTALIVDPTTI